MKTVVSIILISLCTAVQTMSQISGVINKYTKVTAVDLSCNNKITVSSVVDFPVGTKVLIIQMRGASITSTNSSAFGNITSLNDAGNYERAEIQSITGNNIYFKNGLSKTYTPSGFVQLVSIPQYTDITVDGVLKPAP